MPGYKREDCVRKAKRIHLPLMLCCSFLGGYRTLPRSLHGSQSPAPLVRNNRSQAARNPSKDFPPDSHHLLPASVVRPMSQRVTMDTEHPSTPGPKDIGAYTQFSPSLPPCSLDAFRVAQRRDPFDIPRRPHKCGINCERI